MSNEATTPTSCQTAVMCSKYCGDCGNTIRDDGEIFCVVIQSRVDEDDEACDEFSGGEPQYK